MYLTGMAFIIQRLFWGKSEHIFDVKREVDMLATHRQ